MRYNRHSLHKIIALVSCSLLAAMWLVLIGEDKATPEAATAAVLTVVIIAGAVLAATALWVGHNLGIYHRKGPRRGPPLMPPRTDVDRLGRRVAWECERGHRDALHASHLVVVIDGDQKCYIPQGWEWRG